MLSKLPRLLKSRQLLNNATQLSLRLNLYNVPDGAEPLALSLDSRGIFCHAQQCTQNTRSGDSFGVPENDRRKNALDCCPRRQQAEGRITALAPAQR